MAKDNASTGAGSSGSAPSGTGTTVRTQNLRRMASRLAQEGRGEDSVLAHLNSREVGILKLFGGSGKTNPKTGVLEFDDTGSSDGGIGSAASSGGDDTSSTDGSATGMSAPGLSNNATNNAVAASLSSPVSSYGGSIFSSGSGSGGADSSAAGGATPSFSSTTTATTSSGSSPASPAQVAATDASLSAPIGTGGGNTNPSSGIGSAALGLAMPAASLLASGPAVSPLGGLTSGLLSGGGFVGMMNSALNNQPPNPEDVMSMYTGLTPVTALGFGITRMLEALGVEPSGMGPDRGPERGGLGKQNAGDIVNPANNTPIPIGGTAVT